MTITILLQLEMITFRVIYLHFRCARHCESMCTLLHNIELYTYLLTHEVFCYTIIVVKDYVLLNTFIDRHMMTDIVTLLRGQRGMSGGS